MAEPTDPPLVDVGAFDRIEGTGAADDFVAWMAHQRRGGVDDAVAALDLADGDRVLDLGCGPGADLAALATRVGPSGGAVGIDRAAAMTRAARAAAPDAAVVVGDGQALPFGPSTFAGAWARAVLVHTPSPAAAVAELARVVRPGGHVALSEPDHGSHLVATDEVDVFERVRAHRRTTFRHPLVGRDLPALAVGAGLEVVGRWLTPIEHRSWATARAAGGPFDRAVDAAVAGGAVSAEEGRRYLVSLEERDAVGAFLFAALAVTVVARAR
jgi:SAM-dependent methyltransferase